MIKKDLILNQVELKDAQRLANARQEILNALESAERNVERARLNWKRGDVKHAAEELLNISRNGLDVAAARATVNELEHTLALLKLKASE